MTEVFVPSSPEPINWDLQKFFFCLICHEWQLLQRSRMCGMRAVLRCCLFAQWSCVRFQLWTLLSCPGLSKHWWRNMQEEDIPFNYQGRSWKTCLNWIKKLLFLLLGCSDQLPRIYFFICFFREYILWPFVSLVTGATVYLALQCVCFSLWRWGKW